MVISVILVTFVSLTFVGAAMLMQMQIAKMQGYWAERAQVAVFMCRDGSTQTTCSGGEASKDQLAAVADKLKSPALDGIVRSVRFETRDEAYQNVLDLMGEDYKDFITPAQLNETYWVNLVDPTQTEVIDEAFSGMDGVEQVKDQMEYLQPLFSALTIATYFAVAIAGLMLVAAVLLIATTIRLSAYARRKELGIMRLVGASNRFIQTPFILEGVFAALLGSALASVTIWLGVQYGVRGYLVNEIDFVTTWIDGRDALLVIPVIVGLGLVLAALSASFAIRRWLRT